MRVQPNFPHMVYKNYIFINNKPFILQKLKKELIFLLLIFYKNTMLKSAKLRRSWYLKVYFLKVNMRVQLRTKFQGSSLILTSFRRKEEREGNSFPFQNGLLN